MTSEAVKNEREKRKTQREEKLWSAITQPYVLQPLVAIGGALALQKMGKARVIDRDFAGMLLAAWTAYQAAHAGIKDKYALGAITAAATAAYAVTTPPTEEEAIITVDPGKLLGGDGKLFWWDMKDIPIIGGWLGQQ
jgi:hypothetical protein